MTLTDDFPELAAPPQGTDEWHEKRRGKVTASRIADVMAKPRVPGEGMRANYCAQLVAERLTGRVMQTYQSAIMEEAHEWEPKARAFYSFRTGTDVEQVDFVDHLDIPMAGCSPDGFTVVGGRRCGLVEFKCPIINTHMTMLLKGADGIESKYIKQMQFQMACTAMPWCDFVSYNDDLPERMKGIIIRVPRDAGMIGEIEAAVRSFQTEIDLRMSALVERFGK